MMSKNVREMKANFRLRQRKLSIEEKIRQLYAMQERYVQISTAAIRQNLKKPSAEFERACRLLNKNKDL